jgi:diguanylate cyclase (GGDEF)-like protein
MSLDTIEHPTRTGRPAVTLPDLLPRKVWRPMRLTGRRADETDTLTGLCNRRGLRRRIAAAIEAAARHGEAGVLIFCELDALDALVARHGAEAGEAALRLAAAAIRGAVPDIDAVGRIGGGSFAVLLGRVPVDQALAIAARISTGVRGRRLSWRDLALPVAVSVGIAAISGTEDADAMLSRAGGAAPGVA